MRTDAARGGVALSRTATRTQDDGTSGTQCTDWIEASGTASSQTGCQMPVVRWYQMECGSACQSCLPRGFETSSGSSSTRTTSGCAARSSRASVTSKLNGV